jgi:formylglycine-generating enzyme required for sulfatase activity
MDWYGTGYYQPNEADGGSSSNNCANISPATSYRVIRGGSWDSDAVYLRAATRYNYSPSDRYSDIGFRCARTP